MNKGLKLLLGAFTLWPLLYLGLFLIYFVFMFLQVALLGTEEPAADSMLPAAFGIIAVPHILTILWTFVLVGLYIVDLFKTDRIDQDKKALWAVVLFLGGMIAFPVYWYLFVWRSPESAAE
jgi:hypothetical protein